MDGTTEEEELLGEGCFTSIGVTDDGECAPARYLLLKFHCF